MVSASTYRKIHRRTEQAAGCSTGKKAKTTQCAVANAGYGFLKTRFLPVREDKYVLLQNRKKVEGDFFNSLSNLAALYKLEVPELSDEPYPLNIALAYNQAKERLSSMNNDLQLLIVQDDKHTSCITTAATYSVGNKLYYIPVRPLFNMLQHPKKRQTVNLLLSVFSYLYHTAKLPWFSGNSSYLSGCYGMMKEWYLNNDDGEEDETIRESLLLFEKMEHDANKVYQKLKDLSHLKQFENRVNRFKPVSNSEQALMQVACDVLQLMQAYPHRSIFKSIPENFFEPETEERILPEHYLSFFWDCDDFLYDHLMEYINSYLMECGVMNEPLSFQFFDTPQSSPFHDMDFEQRFFKLIDDLCTVLNNLS